MTLLFVTLAVLVIAVVAVLIVRDEPILEAATVPSGPVWQVDDAPLTVERIRNARFAIALRGYRMDQVDEVLEHACSAISQRDVRISDLEKSLNGLLAATHDSHDESPNSA